MKKLLVIFTLGMISMLSAFAMDVKIDNPYKDLKVQVKSKHEGQKVEVCKKNKKGKKKCKLKEADYAAVRDIEVVCYVGNKIPENVITWGLEVNLGPNRFMEQQNFILDGKEGKIVYEVEVKFDKSEKFIKSIKVMINSAKLDGVEFRK